MSDAALRNAEARRDTLAAQINTALQQVEEWRKDLRRTEAFITDWHTFAGTEAGPDSGDTETPKSLYRWDPPAGRNSSKEIVAGAAREIIKARGEPVSRTNLYEALIERGLRINGKEPLVVLSTMLWRMRDAVARVKGGGYWLAEVPYEPAGYIPGQLSVHGIMDKPLGEVAEPEERERSGSPEADPFSENGE